MEDYKASSTSKFEPIVNKEILYDIEISNAKRSSLGGMIFLKKKINISQVLNLISQILNFL